MHWQFSHLAPLSRSLVGRVTPGPSPGKIPPKGNTLFQEPLQAPPARASAENVPAASQALPGATLSQTPARSRPQPQSALSDPGSSGCSLPSQTSLARRLSPRPRPPGASQSSEVGLWH